MLARIIIAIAVVAGVAIATGAGERELPAVAVVAPVAGSVPLMDGEPPNMTRVQSTSCAAECQAQHDSCRVRTKGSPSCDAERQACLQKCLQKRPR